MSRYHRQDCIGKYLKAINLNKTFFVISEHDHYISFIVSGVSWWNVHNKSYKGIEFLSSIIHFESKKRGDLSEIKYTDKIQISLFAFWLFIFTFFFEKLYSESGTSAVFSLLPVKGRCVCAWWVSLSESWLWSEGLGRWKLMRGQCMVCVERPTGEWKTASWVVGVGRINGEDRWVLSFYLLTCWREKIFVSQHAEVLLSVKGKPD